jgi:hypothetical protein
MNPMEQANLGQTASGKHFVFIADSLGKDVDDEYMMSSQIKA